MMLTAKLIKDLLPSSQQWFVDKGYAIRCEEDGLLTLKLTESGHQYFARIIRGEGHAVGSKPDSRKKTPQ